MNRIGKKGLCCLWNASFPAVGKTLLLVSIFCVLAPKLSAEVPLLEGEWTDKKGTKFFATFLTRDQKNGAYVFLDRNEKFVTVAADNLSMEDEQRIAEILKEQDKAMELSAPLTVDEPLVFATEALIERKWTNTEGKTIKGAPIEVTADSLTLKINPKPAVIALEKLQDQDRATALLWSGTTNKALTLPDATFHYKTLKGNETLSQFTIELAGNFSRITTRLVAFDENKNPHTYELRLTTDHASGVYLGDRRNPGGNWIKDTIGKWAVRDQNGGVLKSGMYEAYEEILEMLPRSEMVAVGPWLGRRILIRKDHPSFVKSAEVVFVRLPESNLSAALRIALACPKVEEAEPKNLQPWAKPQTSSPFHLKDSGLVSIFSDLLETLRLQDIAVVMLSCDMQDARPLSANGRYTVALEKVEFTEPGNSDFFVDPEALSLDAGTYKSLAK